MAFLLGTWTSTITSGYGSMQASVSYAKDGTFRAVFTSSVSTVQIWGNWTAVPVGNGRIQINTNPTGWDPLQVCDAYGYCTPQFFYPEATQIQIMDENTVQSPSGTFRRVG